MVRKRTTKKEKTERKFKFPLKGLFAKLTNSKVFAAIAGFFKKIYTRIKDFITEKADLHVGSIKFKLLMGFLIPCVLIIVSGILSYNMARKAVIDRYKVSMQNTIQKTAEYYDLLITNLSIRVSQITYDDTVKKYYRGSYADDPLSERKISSNVKKYILTSALSDEFVSKVYVLADYGDNFISDSMLKVPSFETYSQSDDGAIQLESEEDVNYVGKHTALDELSKNDSSSYAFALQKNMVDKKSNPIGVVIMDIEMDAVKAPLLDMDMDEGAMCALITTDKKQIASTDEQFFFGDMSEYDDFVASEDEATSFYAKDGWDSYLYIFHKLENSGFVVCSRIPEKVISEQVSHIRILSVIIILVAVALSVVLSIWILKRLITAIRNITVALNEVAAGRLNVVVKPSKDQEFVQLNRQLEHMIENVRSLIMKTNQGSGEVAEAGMTVANTTDTLVSLSDNVHERIVQVSNGVTKQTLDANNCRDTIGGLARDIEAVYSDAKAAGEVAEGAGRTVGESISYMHDLSDKASETAEITEDLIVKVNDLSHETNAINQIVESINNVSDQTALLAINASIEAAHVGAMGKGFAVVAEEIKKLSDQTVEAVEEIKKIVERIDEKKTTVAKITEAASESIREQSRAMSATAESFAAVRESVKNLISSLSDITLILKRMEDSKDRSIEMINSMTEVSENNQEAAASMQESTALQTEQIYILKKAVESLGIESEALSEAISQFTM
ncbi:MAG: methyl-accepting chemotaxis protein [Lachnospiraceae bacterium]|nr:methyl-accepting chemotaxis protein [Lachnospiraceae bacterium]